MQQHGAGENRVTTHEEQILEAIDQLRRRKARPDKDRICNYLLRNYSVDAVVTIEELRCLSEAEKVIQVDYKGSLSYRNASNWSRLAVFKTRPDASIKDKLNSSAISNSISELIVEEPDYLYMGVPGKRLIKHLLEGSKNQSSRKMIDDFLTKEVAKGRLTKLSNGNYSLLNDTDKTNQRYSSSRDGNSPEYPDYKDKDKGNNTITVVDAADSRSNTPRLTRQISSNNNDSADVAVKEPDSPEESSTKEQQYNNSLMSEIKKGEPKGDDGCNSNLKRSSKSERKQRLQVRADDSMDLELNFEEFEKSANSLKESLKRARELEEQYSDDNEDAGRSSTNTSPTPSNNLGGRSARRKRAKKVFDPSDNNVVKRKRGRQSGGSTKNVMQYIPEPIESPVKMIGSKDGPNRQCSLCAKDKPEGLIACRDCTVRGHPSCIYSPEELLLKSRCSWQCQRCKTCTLCCETSESGNLVTCMHCDDAYHHSCHTPKIPSKASTKWKCCHCSDKYHHDKPEKTSSSKHKEHKDLKEPLLTIITPRPETPTNPSNQPPVLSPQVSPTRSLIDQMDEDLVPREIIDPNIPDASDWTTEQVYQYFARLFGPKEAEVFRVQDIDGHSLLMMKRSDVLIGMDLLLGPALKIYRHVLKLQMRCDDTKFYWL